MPSISTACVADCICVMKDQITTKWWYELSEFALKTVVVNLGVH